MKALTIKQPWAYAILAGYKNIENRSWPTRYRGPLAIHAAAADAAEGHRDERVIRMLSVLHEPDEDVPYDRGAVIAVADLVDCHPAKGGCCAPWGDDYPSPKPIYHWQLARVSPLVEPLVVKGRQQLWNVDLPRHLRVIPEGEASR